MTAGFADDVLNSLTANIAVLDARGVIVAVNDAWRRFSRENGGDENAYLGANYLTVCEESHRRGDATALAALSGLQALLRGERQELSFEYPCNSPAEERWFLARMTPFSRGAAAGLAVAHEDITARKRVESALRETEQTLRKVLETLPVGVWIMDKTGCIVHGNPAGLRIWGGARFVGPDQFGEYKGWWLSTGQPIAAEEWAAARAIRQGETSIDEEIRIECFDGSQKIILNSGIPLRDAQGGVTGAIIVNQDITRRKQAEDELLRTKQAVEVANRELQEALAREQVLARTDALTGAFNRRHFFTLAERELAVARRYHHPLSVILLDVDHFKQVNDRMGHQCGDEMLKRVAESARSALRETDLLARYGGEELIVLLPETSAARAAAVAERIRRNVAAHGMSTDQGLVGVTVSLGIAEVLPGEDNLDRLVLRADQALYAAKEAGRNRSVVSPPVSQPKHASSAHGGLDPRDPVSAGSRRRNR